MKITKRNQLISHTCFLIFKRSHICVPSLLILLVAFICWAHGILTLHTLSKSMPADGQAPFWHGGIDTECYVANAQAIGTDSHFIKVFKERLVLPVLFRLSGATREDPFPYLELAQVMRFLMPLVLAAASWTLFKNKLFALLSALFSAFWAGMGSLIVLTDYLHGFLFVLAMWTTWAYLRDGTWGWMFASIVAWWCCMLTRPTFLWVGMMLLPVMFFRTKSCREWWIRSVIYMGLLLLVPVLLSAHNFHVYGVATPTFNALENIHTVLIPGIHTTLRKRTEVETNSAQIWHEERDLKAWHEANYASLELWNADLPENCSQFRAAYQTVKKTDAKEVLDHLDIVVELMVSECERLLLNPKLDNPWVERFRCLFVIAALSGVIVAWRERENRASVCAAMLCGGWILASSSTFLWAEQRFVYPVILLMIPFAVTVIGRWQQIILFGLGLLTYKACNMLIYRPLFGLMCAMLVMVLSERGTKLFSLHHEGNHHTVTNALKSPQSDK